LFFCSVKAKVSDIQLDLVPSSGVESALSSGSKTLDTIGWALTPRLGLIDSNGTAVELRLIHLGDGRLGAGSGSEGDEAEAARARGAAFHGEEDIGDFAEFSKDFAEAGLVSRIVQVTNIKLHLLSSATTAGITIGVVTPSVSIGGCVVDRRGTGIGSSSSVSIGGGSVGRPGAGAGSGSFT